MGKNSRLRLGRVVAQGNRLSLDLVETLLAEVVPVSKKPKFWWTTPFPKAQSIIDSATGGQPPIGTGHGQGRVPQAEASRKWKRRTAGSRHRNSQSWFWGVKVRGWVWRCMVGQGKSKPMLTPQPLEGKTDKSHGPGNKTRTNIQDNTQQRAEAKHSIRNLDMRGWATATTITAGRAGTESTEAKLEEGTGAGSCSTGHNADNEQIWTRRHRRLLSCSHGSF